MSSMKLLDHWSAPDGAGQAVACLATTFTFDPQFFTDDCLSRFLALTAVTGEGDKASSISAVIEEEQRLSETAAVSVLIDRGTAADKRNLRWDILPVSAGTGLLHAKVSVLIWERHARIVVGSANLTKAGYRSQIESAIAFDIGDKCALPQAPLRGIVDELMAYLDLLPAEAGKSVDRARGTLALITERIDEKARTSAPPDLRLAAAPSAPGTSPLAQYAASWGSSKRPLRATVLSPFWDKTSAKAIDEIKAVLTGQPATARSITAVVGQDYAGAWQAPVELVDRVSKVRALKRTDDERRALHAKVVLLENDDWVSALLGSSNVTIAGLGLSPTKGHRELNVWIGAPRTSPVGKALRGLVSTDKALDLASEQLTEGDSEEWMLPTLPAFFSWCTVFVDEDAARARFTFSEADAAPASWAIREPQGATLIDHTSWQAQETSSTERPISRDAVPSIFDVEWSDESGSHTGCWVATIDDTTHLPAPAELLSLTADQLLRALASTRPFPANIEEVLHRDEQRSATKNADVIDPLSAFDSSGLLMYRMRRHSDSLWGMQQRLGHPTPSIDVIRNRLHGVLGPIAIARRLVDEATTPGVAAESETAFLLAEIALTVSAVNWPSVVFGPDSDQAPAIVGDALLELEQLSNNALSVAADPSVREYVQQAFQHARTSCGI